MSPTHKAFFYGTLMSPTVLHHAVQSTNTHPKNLTVTPAILPSYARRKVKSAPYPAIVPASAAHSVRGTLVSHLSDADMARLDAFEGDEYERRRVRVLVPVSSSSSSSVSGGKRGEVVGAEVGVADEGEGESEVEQKEVEVETYVWIAGLDQLEDGEWDFDQFVKENMGGFLLDEGLVAG